MDRSEIQRGDVALWDTRYIPRIVRVLSTTPTSNTAVIQIRNLNEQADDTNTITVLLSDLQPRQETPTPMQTTTG